MKHIDTSMRLTVFSFSSLPSRTKLSASMLQKRHFYQHRRSPPAFSHLRHPLTSPPVSPVIHISLIFQYWKSLPRWLTSLPLFSVLLAHTARKRANKAPVPITKELLELALTGHPVSVECQQIISFCLDCLTSLLIVLNLIVVIYLL